MYPLETIHTLNASPSRIKDNFNRDSSFIQSRLGYVIHSGVHRSTAFISITEHEEGHAAFTFWRDYGQAAIDGFIEATIDGADLEACEETACKRTWPEWTFEAVKGSGTLQGATVCATRGDVRISGLGWRDIHARLHVLKQRALAEASRQATAGPYFQVP